MPRNRDFFAHGALERLFHFLAERFFRACQGHVVLWTLGARNRRHDCTHVEGQCVCVDRRIVVATPETVLFCIGFNQCDPVLIATRSAQITQCFVVDGEEATCRSILWGHVGDCGTIRKWQRVETFAVELNELPNNTLFTKHFNDFENKVRSCRAFHHCARQLEADDFWDQHGNRLAEHGRFRLDSTNAPTENSCTVHHGCVAVRAHKRVRVGNFITVLVHVGPNRLAEILKVHLVTNTCAWRNNAEV